MVKKLHKNTPFQLVYRWEAVVPAEFAIQRIFIDQETKMIKEESLEKWLDELLELDEAIFLVYFHQMVEKQRKKVWHDRHMKKSAFTFDGHVILCNNKFLKFRRKLQMH